MAKRSKVAAGVAANAIVCLPKMLPRNKWIEAADRAAAVNPVNRPAAERLSLARPGFALTREHIAVITTKYWQSGGVKLTVGFMDNPPADLRKRILLHMNAWGKTGNIQFTASNSHPQVRIARIPNDGYWSYVGTDVLTIPANEPTMNLEAFTMQTPDSEFYRVVRHETGHTLGFPHEHMRKDLVSLIDEAKAIAFFGATQGWDEDMVRRQVLTSIEEGSLIATDHADPNSIMCYQIPGTLTKNGQPIVGGLDIDKIDYTFVGRIYPKAKTKKPAAAPAKRKPARARAAKKTKKKAGPKKGAKKR